MGAAIFVTLFLGKLGVIHYFRRRVAVGFLRRFDAIRDAPVYDAEAMDRLTADVGTWVAKKNPTLGGTLSKDVPAELRGLRYGLRALEIMVAMDPKWHRERSEAAREAKQRLAASNAKVQRKIDAVDAERAAAIAEAKAFSACRARALFEWLHARGGGQGAQQSEAGLFQPTQARLRQGT